MKNRLWYTFLLISISCVAQAQKNAISWRLGANYGYSKRIASVSGSLTAQQKSHVEKGLSGTAWGVDVTCFLKPDIGIGFSYAQFQSSNSTSNMAMPGNNDTTYVYSSFSDKYTIRFIGPFFATRFLSKDNKHAFWGNIGLGYLGYINDEAINASHYTVRNLDNTVSTYLAAYRDRVTITAKGATLGLLFGGFVNKIT